MAEAPLDCRVRGGVPVGVGLDVAGPRFRTPTASATRATVTSVICVYSVHDSVETADIAETCASALWKDERWYE